MKRYPRICTRNFFSFMKDKENIQSSAIQIVQKTVPMTSNYFDNFKDNFTQKNKMKDMTKHYCFLINDTPSSQIPKHFYDNLGRLILGIDNNDFYSLHTFTESGYSKNDETTCQLGFAGVNDALDKINTSSECFRRSYYYGSNFYNSFMKISLENQKRNITQNLLTVYVVVASIPDTTDVGAGRLITHLERIQHNCGIIFVGITEKMKLDPIYDLFTYGTVGKVLFNVPVHLENCEHNEIERKINILKEAMCATFKSNSQIK